MLRSDPVLWQFDESKMNAQWANDVVTVYRRDWGVLIGFNEYVANKKYLLSIQKMDDIQKYFDDEEFRKNVKFRPLPIMEKTKNILIDKARKSGIRPYIKAIDPAAIKDKERDRFRVQNRRKLEGDINSERQKIGLPPFKMGYDKFKGNIEEFDQMQLSENENSDLDFFFKTYYKLNYETQAQNILDAINQLNKSSENASRLIIDILVCKHLCKQTYISPQTGQIKDFYLEPPQVRIIWGNNIDGSDAPVKGWVRNITVMQLLNYLGNMFNFEDNWQQLISAINYANAEQFDGFIKGGYKYNMNAFGEVKEGDSEREYRFLDWSQSYNYKIAFGYIEWDQIVAHSEKVNPRTGQMFSTTPDFVPPKRSIFEKKTWYANKVLCSYFIATGDTSQWLYGYGPLYHQLIEGQYDEYARGSITVIREEGIPAIEVAKPYIDLANYAYYKMLWATHHSKPDVWDYSYESIVEIAKKIQPNTEGSNTPQGAGGMQSAIQSLVKLFHDKLILLHTFPIKDGQAMGGGGTQHAKIPGQLDALAPQLRELILEWAENQILDKLGMAGIANASQPNPKEGLKLNQLYLSQSNAATGYIYDMYQRFYESSARMILLYVQDIIKHKDTIPYNALKKLVGEEVIASVEELEDIAYHRFGIFVTSLDTMSQKEEMDQAAVIALERGEIDFAQWMLLKQIDDPRLAAMKLSYMKERAAKIAQDRAMELERMRQQTVQMQNESKMQQISTKGQWDLQSAQVAADASVRGKELDYRRDVDTKQMQLMSEAPKQQQRTESDKELLETKANLDQQASMVE